ncbi:hypothetical protein MRX96_027365 [Rhipicephalus microplus]
MRDIRRAERSLRFQCARLDTLAGRRWSCRRSTLAWTPLGLFGREGSSRGRSMVVRTADGTRKPHAQKRGASSYIPTAATHAHKDAGLRCQWLPSIDDLPQLRHVPAHAFGSLSLPFAQCKAALPMSNRPSMRDVPRTVVGRTTS